MEPKKLNPIIRSIGNSSAEIRTDYAVNIDSLPDELKKFVQAHLPEVDFKKRVDTLALNCGCGGGNCVC